MKQFVSKAVYEHIYHLHLVILMNCVRIPEIHIGRNIGNVASNNHCLLKVL